MKEYYTFMSQSVLDEILDDSISHQISERDGGYQIVVNYPNGYGASIVKFNGSDGARDDLWELSVLEDGEVAYNTGVTNDVLGHLSEEAIAAYCEVIRYLPSWDKWLWYDVYIADSYNHPDYHNGVEYYDPCPDDDDEDDYDPCLYSDV